MGSTSVKVFASTDPGAPVLSGSAGALVALLKACLVDGRGTQAVQNLTVAAGIATATYATAHPFAVSSVALFAGSTPAELNGEQRILSVVNANTVTFAAPGVADGAATGSISSKLAPAGWTELYAGTANTLAIKSGAIEATGCCLRVDDTTTTTARVRGFESMTAINAGSGLFPTDVQVNGGMYWPKSDAASSAARAWRLIADGLAFVLWVAPANAYQGHGVAFGFGDMIADKSGDAYACALSGGASNIHTSAVAVGGCFGYGHGVTASAGGEMYVARAFTGIGGSQAAKKTAPYNAAAGYSGTAVYNANAFPFPNPADNSLRLAPLEALVGGSFRGRMAGIYHAPQVMGESFQTGDVVIGSGYYAGKPFIALRVGAPNAALSGAGVVFVSLDTWR